MLYKMVIQYRKNKYSLQKTKSLTQNQYLSLRNVTVFISTILFILCYFKTYLVDLNWIIENKLENFEFMLVLMKIKQ